MVSEQVRWIIHADLDAFFASVEELHHPEWRGKPIIVGGDPSRRAVVSSASYAARRFGVHSAMPVSQALRLCPKAIVAPPHYDEYTRHSHAVMDIMQEITPAVEQISIDEAFLDVSGCERLWGPVEQIAEMIQRRVRERVRLPVSLGIATSKLVAKIACDLGKPKGRVLVPPGQEKEFLAPLPIRRLWGVGQVTATRLGALGIETIGDLALWEEEQLVQRFGEVGHVLYSSARGIDPSKVHTERERRSISQELTFAQDTDDRELIARTLLRMADTITGRLRAAGLVAQTVRIKLRHTDFTTLTRQTTLRQPTDQSSTVYVESCHLLEANWRGSPRLRLLGMGVSGLLERGGYQLDLFEHRDQKSIQLSRAVDAIRGKYGRKAIIRASLLADRTRDSDGEDVDPL